MIFRPLFSGFCNNDMIIDMKTTIHIDDRLLEEAKRIASQEHTTIKTLIEEGLRKIISEKKKKSRFHLRKASFKGKGLQTQFAEAKWEKIRDEAYNCS